MLPRSVRPRPWTPCTSMSSTRWMPSKSCPVTTTRPGANNMKRSQAFSRKPERHYLERTGSIMAKEFTSEEMKQAVKETVEHKKKLQDRKKELELLKKQADLRAKGIDKL